MFGRLFSTALRKAPPASDTFDQDVESAQRETEKIHFSPMIPLQPPPAQNDDPLHDFCPAVEEQLRSAGYLR